MDIGAATIKRWHLDRGWSDIGYHFVIRRNGQLEKGRALETPGAHVEGHNTTTIGICLVGGLDANGKPEMNYTKEQMAQLFAVVAQLKHSYPSAVVLGHRDFPAVSKACPCFSAIEWANSHGL